MTRVGEVRQRYRLLEQAPSRFSSAYRDWSARADLWGKGLELFPR